MDLDKFTEKAIDVFENAQKMAIRKGNSSIEEIHMHYGLLEDRDGFIYKVLSYMDKDVEEIIEGIMDVIDDLPKDSSSSPLYAGRSYTKVILDAEEEMERSGESKISVEHLYRALITEEGTESAVILEDHGIDLESFEKCIETMKNMDIGEQKESRDIEYEELLKYGRDLVQEVRDGKIDPVIGRDDEIRNTIRILSRRTKNNPVLIGEAGVGKTAIVEGLAHRIVSGEVPEGLMDKRIYALDMGAVVAGAKFMGEFEERLKNIIDIIEDSNGQIIMFIDELHLIVGAGQSQGAMDASNLLKPMLARGLIKTIGATTLEEYSKFIEKDAALERRFQSVLVEEPTVENTISILRGVKERYEIHHGIRISDGAVIAATNLSDRYIMGRFLPDKAIDLMDEASAMIRTEIDSMPVEIDEIRRRILKLELEREALKKEDDDYSDERLLEINDELSEHKENYNHKIAKWEEEKKNLLEIKNIKEQIDKTKRSIEEAERSYDLEKLSKLKYGEIIELRSRLEEANKRIDSMDRMLKEEVTEDEIAEVVEKWTGIPVNKLVETEKERLLNLDKILQERVVGQEKAVEAVSGAVIRARAGIKDVDSPVGSFLFLGPTGVGKTELSKALTEALFDDDRSIIRLDMSEYMEKHSVSRLVGAPPGYIGYDEGGQLTEAVRRRPYSVVLFDEIEKAHPDIFNVLLQVLDEGRLTDNQGRTVDFKNTVIIMTSNIGSSYILEDLLEDGIIDVKTEQKIMEELTSMFSPEFLNRVDELVLFEPLKRDELFAIIDLQIREIENRLKDRRIKINFTRDAKELVLDRSNTVQYGARPIKRYLQREFETKMARIIIEERLEESSQVLVNVKNDKLNIEIK